MSYQRNAGKITVPDDLRDVLLEFTISYLLEQPSDIIDYAVDFFTRLRDTRQAQLIHDEEICISPEIESVEEEEGEFARSRRSNRSNRFVDPRTAGSLPGFSPIPAEFARLRLLPESSWGSIARSIHP